jgi:hypothetical protein
MALELNMRLNEIYPGLMACDFLDTEDNLCFWRVWLWESPEALGNWIDIHRPHQKDLKGADGIHCGMYFTDDVLGQQLGDLHFIKGVWDEEVVAHELMHAFMWFAAGMIPDFSRIVYSCDRMDDEEKYICYPFGRWFGWLYPWLWKVNPRRLR